MGEDTVVRFQKPEARDALTELLREGAQQLLRQAVQTELEQFLAAHAGERDEHGRAAVVRNGHLPEREVLTGIGAVAVRVPKVRSRTGDAVVFRSSLVPPYVRKAKSVEAALPWLYLRGFLAVMSNVTPIRPDEPGQGSDAFDVIYDAMQDELAALRCVLSATEASALIDADEQLSAARSLLRRTFRRLDGLHSELAAWRMADVNGDRS